MSFCATKVSKVWWQQSGSAENNELLLVILATEAKLATVSKLFLISLIAAIFVSLAADGTSTKLSFTNKSPGSYYHKREGVKEQSFIRNLKVLSITLDSAKPAGFRPSI